MERDYGYRNSAIQNWRDRNPTAARFLVMYADRKNLHRNATPPTALLNCRYNNGVSADEHEFDMHWNFQRHLQLGNFVDAAKFLYFYIPEFSTSEEVCYATGRNYIRIRGVQPIVDRSLCHIGCCEELPIVGYMYV